MVNEKSPVLPGRRSLRLALIHLGLSGVAVTGLLVLLLPAAFVVPLWALIGYTLIGLLYFEAGVLAWWRRPGGRMGVLLVGCGAAFLLTATQNSAVPVLAVLGTVTQELPIAVVMHLVLAFPTGRLPDRWSRWLVVAGYVDTVVLLAPLYLFGATPTAATALTIADRPDLVSITATARGPIGFVIIALIALQVARRWRAADPAQRQVLAAVCGYGVFTLLFLSLSAIIARVTGLDPLVLYFAQVGVVAGLPFAFVAGLLRGGFARTAEIEELGAWLGATDGARPALQAALSAALGDPSLDLLFWLPDEQRFAHAAGDPVRPPGPSRGTVDVEVAGERVGAIVYDSVSIPDPETVQAAGRVVALAVERERLIAELLSGRQALRESRTRIVESGDQERRRIARDLHDGLQSRLVVLALHAGRLAAHPAVADEAGALRAGVQGAIEELRGLVHGILPALLLQRGLYAAAEELLERVPIASSLECPHDDAALPAAVESAGYFTVAEALTNAIKHARAHKLQVRLTRTDETLVIEVVDDGVGGADVASGGGLRGIADRLEALGGRLRVHSRPEQGTTLIAELPCGS